MKKKNFGNMMRNYANIERSLPKKVPVNTITVNN